MFTNRICDGYSKQSKKKDEFSYFLNVDVKYWFMKTEPLQYAKQSKINGDPTVTICENKNGGFTTGQYDPNVYGENYHNSLITSILTTFSSFLFHESRPIQPPVVTVNSHYVPTMLGRIV